MYVVVPPNAIRAVDATTGEQIWEHKRPSGQARIKAIAMYDDMVYYTAPDGLVRRWTRRPVRSGGRQKTDGGMTVGRRSSSRARCSAGRTCSPAGANCYIAAHDAKTGKELWKFYTAAGADDPGGDNPGAAHPSTAAWRHLGPARRRTIRAATRDLWGIANPMPNTRRARHDGNFDAMPTYPPADLYSNSTVALESDTGKLAWYFQHLPGDDWDQDYTNERIAASHGGQSRSEVREVDQPRHPARASSATVGVIVGEGGGIFVLDRATGSSCGRRRSRMTRRTS